MGSCSDDGPLRTRRTSEGATPATRNETAGATGGCCCGTGDCAVWAGAAGFGWTTCLATGRAIGLAGATATGAAEATLAAGAAGGGAIEGWRAAALGAAWGARTAFDGSGFSGAIAGGIEANEARDCTRGGASSSEAAGCSSPMPDWVPDFCANCAEREMIVAVPVLPSSRRHSTWRPSFFRCRQWVSPSNHLLHL